jgi:hypothetical protein
MGADLLAGTDSRAVPTIVVVVSAVLALPLFAVVHLGLRYWYLSYALRYCRKRGIEPVEARGGPQFGESGIKTEYTIVELIGVDTQGQRRQVRLLVWMFGIRKVLADETLRDDKE